MTNVVPMNPGPTNGEPEPKRFFIVHYVIQVAGMPQQHFGATVSLKHPPSTPEEIQQIAAQMANQVQVQARDEKGVRVIGAAPPPVTVMVLGWQELGK